MTRFEQAKELFLAGDYAGAEEVCRGGLEENPDDKAVRLLHGSCLAKLAMAAKEGEAASSGPTPEEGAEDADSAARHDMLSTQELPLPSAGRGRRPWGGFRVAMWILGGLSAAFLLLMLAARLSVRSEEKARLPFLWTARALGLEAGPAGMERVAEPAGHFSVGLPRGFDRFAEVREFAVGEGRLYEACAHWTYPSLEDEGRVDVSYVRLPEGKGVFGDNGPILAFDNLAHMPIEFGIAPITAVLGDDIEVLDRGRAKEDALFIRKHRATGYAACFATVRIAGKEYRVFQVSLTRGREAWRIQTTLPSAGGADAGRAELVDMLAAGEIIGRFRTLEGAAVPAPGKTEEEEPSGIPLPGVSESTGTEDRRMATLLDAPPAVARIRPERIVGGANFAIRLPGRWTREADVWRPDALPRGFAASEVYRFLLPGEDEWFGVEYMKLDPSRPTDDHIEDWVWWPLMIAGKPNLLEPDGVEADVRWFVRIPACDPAFLARHKADRMCLFVGRGSVGGKPRQYGVLCLNRGQESWRMVAAVQGDLREVSVGPCTREEKWAKTLGRFFGTFRILSEERIGAAGR